MEKILVIDYNFSCIYWLYRRIAVNRMANLVEKISIDGIIGLIRGIGIDGRAGLVKKTSIDGIIAKRTSCRF